MAVFKPDLIQRACRGERYRPLKRKRSPAAGVLHCALNPDAFAALSREMKAVVEDGLDPDLLNREAGFGLNKDFRFRHNDPDWLNAALRHILLFAWRLQEAGDAAGRAVLLHPAVRKALDGMEKTPSASTDLASLAASCGVSPSFLSRRFHREVGVTLSRYRNSVRLGRFWEKLRSDPAANLLDAAYAAGFGSYAQFYRVYTDAYGVSPRRSIET